MTHALCRAPLRRCRVTQPRSAATETMGTADQEISAHHLINLESGLSRRAVTARHPRRLVVECDCHWMHERRELAGKALPRCPIQHVLAATPSTWDVVQWKLASGTEWRFREVLPAVVGYGDRENIARSSKHVMSSVERLESADPIGRARWPDRPPHLEVEPMVLEPNAARQRQRENQRVA